MMVLQFFGDVDAEIYLEYPLFSSGASHATVRRTAKLEVKETDSFDFVFSAFHQYLIIFNSCNGDQKCLYIT